MLNQPTLATLRSMKLTGMADAYAQQLDQPEAQRLSFDERLAMLVDRESGVVSLSRTRVCLSFYVLSSLIVKKFRAWPITAVAPVELDEIDHSSSEKKSFSSYWPFSRSETKVKGSAVLRSKARCLRSP